MGIFKRIRKMRKWALGLVLAFKAYQKLTDFLVAEEPKRRVVKRRPEKKSTKKKLVKKKVVKRKPVKK